MPDLTRALADFATGSITTTPAARLVTSLSALDWIAVGRAGVEEPVSRILREMVLDEGGTGRAHLFGGGAAPLRGAALVNGTVSHALDYDDTHFAHIGHPSVAVFPAVLAMAEARDAAIVELLEAALVGMELSVRVGLWLGRGHYQAGFHQTATAGAFGAAAAAGRMAGLTPERMALALGLTATRAAGLKAQFGTMGKPYNAGLAAAAGIEAVELVRRGFVANPLAMEGEYGFGATHHGAGEMSALEGLGESWLFEQVSHKFHACCHGLHAALEAARSLDIAAPEVATLTVRTHPRWLSVCNQQAPTTGLGAKFSYGTVLAMRALGHDTARLDSYSDAICADPRLIQLRDRVEVSGDESLSETQAHLSLLRRDGQRQEVSHDLMAPLTLSEREERVRAKAAKLIGGGAADEIWALLRTGGGAADLASRLTAG
ncbi:MmgE/PrpD family protein [Ruegeria pomeroyi]|uniref:MmgE/PrpD family protein n=1 Tax=Ruegeria pomeroyi TaxID=89184 RepID=A0A9Q3ZKG0_9RHOB|nr:MmgE/PrpD family protein [Ruegeria pomeroyi]MCE8535888.1 MmgE/PrpD family protein [Ruegeria pomeroyi]MCE8554769.1 MmgE/PrpD family protein [Ruegeria pomeroyi]